MTRRASLPGASELFRTTGTSNSDTSPPAAEADPVVAPTRAPKDRTSSGREKHDEKITVYCSPSELVALETTRLHLRAEHGLAADRGRVVREALAVVLADFEANGADSILVRRLRGE